MALAMAAYHIYAGAFGRPEALFFRGIHLAFALVLIFLWFPARKGAPPHRASAGDWVALALGLAAIGYLFWNYDYVVTRYIWVDPLAPADMVFALSLTLVVLETTRRTIGPALPITALVFLLYALAGPYLPGPLRHRGFSLELVLDQMYLTTDAIFGIPLDVSATYVILFVIFGAFLERSGTGKLFMDFASSLAGHTPGGPGKVSCISSGLFGTISGSAVANVMVDGWLTIPLMKRTGFRPPFAAAVEAVASTGGQIMPPVMGAAAFVMAEFLGIPYITVAKHAAIPAILYYLALFMAIHFEAQRTGLHGLSRAELPRMGAVLGGQGNLFMPLFIIVYLMLAGYTAPMAALWGIAGSALTLCLGRVAWLVLPLLLVDFLFPGLHVAARQGLGGALPALLQRFLLASNANLVLTSGFAALAALRLGTRRGRRRLKPDCLALIPGALVDGAKNTLGVAAACACAGIVIGVIALTGAGLQFTSAVLAASRDSLIPALILTMLAGIVLGMGMPTTAAYIVQAALLIPALIKLGVLPIAAHMFVFYFAIISAITPPVAMAVYAAAGIGKTPLWATGLSAMRLGATGFIVPFMFVYGPSLLFVGTWTEVLTTIVAASIGVTCLAASLHGYLLRPAAIWQRAVLFVAALLLIVPGYITDLMGLVLLGVVVVAQWMARAPVPVPAAPAPATSDGPAVELDADRIERLQRGA
jgi:TRAP transporter 4TM/12TM fusion protein